MASNKESEPEAPKRRQSAIDANGDHSLNDQFEERAKDQQSQEDHRDSERSREPPAEDSRPTGRRDDSSTPMSISPLTLTHPPNQEGLICGNCSEAGHSLADCTYNIDQYGYLNGCPRCNTLSHNYADCAAPIFAQDDYFYLITKRHGKPPLRCRWDFRLGYWKKFKECVYEDDTTAMRPQTAAFAKARRDKGVVQMWNEIVLDPIWYGRTDWSTNVGKMVHPLDKEWMNPYNRQVVDLSGEDNGGLGDRGREPEWKRGKRAADGERGVDEYGRLRREEGSDLPVDGGPVQEVCGGEGENQGMSRRLNRATMQPWSRNGRSQGGGQDGRSWKKRRLQDQRMDQQSFGDPFGQAVPTFGHNQGQHYGQPHSQTLGFGQPTGAGSNHGSYSSPSSTPGYHGVNETQQQRPPQIAPPQAEQQRPPKFHDIQNSFPPISPAQLTNGREYGKYKAEEARKKLGPIPGWKPRTSKSSHDNGNGNGNGYKKPWQNNGRGGFQNMDQGQQQANERPYVPRQRDNLGHHGNRHLTNSQDFPQRNFDFRATTLPPAQPLNRPGTQFDGSRAQTSQHSNTFNVQHGITPSKPITEGPNSSRVAAIIASRGGQKTADRNHDGMHDRQSTQQSNGRHEPGHEHGTQHQQPGRNGGGYCVNCRSYGHVVEECEGNCGLCRAGGRKARECRFFGLGRG